VRNKGESIVSKIGQPAYRLCDEYGNFKLEVGVYHEPPVGESGEWVMRRQHPHGDWVVKQSNLEEEVGKTAWVPTVEEAAGIVRSRWEAMLAEKLKELSEFVKNHSPNCIGVP
jgi:hypothetical protein